MISIKIPIKSEKKAVKSFLKELQELLNSEKFDIGADLIIIKSDKDAMKYSTNYTMADLDYDVTDIVARLKELTVSEYSETLVDNADDKPPLLFVFGKDINGRLVYIKLKIKGETTRKILCLSFHYAKYSIFPINSGMGERSRGNE